MKFALLIYVDQAARDAKSPEEVKAGYAEWRPVQERLAANKAHVFDGELQVFTTATTVRTKDGVSVLTDGPFAETAEHLRGFLILEAKDQEEAVSYARMLTDTVEVRPLMER